MHYSKLYNHATGCGSSAFSGGKNNIILSQIITHKELQAGLLKARIIIQIVTNKIVTNKIVTNKIVTNQIVTNQIVKTHNITK